jgi:hypothetical protein
MGDTVRTRYTRSMVSCRSVASDIRGVALAAVLVVTACAGRHHPVARTRPAASGESNASDTDAERPADVLQFDNQATVYVDVYLVAGQNQWRLGRVLPGMSAMLKVPESALDWPTGFMQLAVIPGSLVSAEAWRDPRAVVAVAQPVSEVLFQRWTFRQPAGAVPHLQATRLVERR